jgi:hypothetical protein
MEWDDRTALGYQAIPIIAERVEPTSIGDEFDGDGGIHAYHLITE